MTEDYEQKQNLAIFILTHVPVYVMVHRAGDPNPATYRIEYQDQGEFFYVINTSHLYAIPEPREMSMCHFVIEIHEVSGFVPLKTTVNKMLQIHDDFAKVVFMNMVRAMIHDVFRRNPKMLLDTTIYRDGETGIQEYIVNKYLRVNLEERNMWIEYMKRHIKTIFGVEGHPVNGLDADTLIVRYFDRKNEHKY